MGDTPHYLPTDAMTLREGVMTLVASHSPPDPTSTTATSIRSAAKCIHATMNPSSKDVAGIVCWKQRASASERRAFKHYTQTQKILFLLLFDLQGSIDH